MKLNYAGISDADAWEGYALPRFDIQKTARATREQPEWLHLGAGNIARAFLAAVQQRLLEQGLTDKGLIVGECYDGELIPACYAPYDNLSVLVILKEGGCEKRVIASVTESLNLAAAGAEERRRDTERFLAVMSAPSLRIVSFTVTEKGYSVAGADGNALPYFAHDAENGPAAANTLIGLVAAGLFARYKNGAFPLALLSLDNCAQNGAKLKDAVMFAARSWAERGFVPKGFTDYIDESVTFPWSMIDKITPRPSLIVKEMLEADGYEDAQITETAKHTYASSFVNAEECEYLVIEDAFPNGRPPLERAGVILADRETVQKAEQMKVGACLNPLHTILGTCGMLLGYQTIYECMRDERLVKFIRRAAYDEALPVAANPGVLDPGRFLEEVLTKRFPNPFIPDTPARIVCDNSQKIPPRFGEMLKTRLERGLPLRELEAVPLFFAMYCRYLRGVDDRGEPLALSPDPRLPELTARMSGVTFGGPYKDALRPILSDATLFGVDLYDGAAGLGEKAEGFFAELNAGPGAVSGVLSKMFL